MWPGCLVLSYLVSTQLSVPCFSFLLNLTYYSSTYIVRTNKRIHNPSHKGWPFPHAEWISIFLSDNLGRKTIAELSNYSLCYTSCWAPLSWAHRVQRDRQQTECRPRRMDVGVCGCRAEALGLNIVWLDSGKKAVEYSVRADGQCYGEARVTRWLNTFSQTDGLWLCVSCFLWMTLAFLITFYYNFICTYQWAAGLHEHLCGAVPDAIRDACCSVHGANHSFLPGLLGILHQLHRHAEFSKVLHPCTGRSTLLPKPKMTIMADRWGEKRNSRKRTRQEWDAYSLECISMSENDRRASARRWDHYQRAAYMYFYCCLLLPALKQIILKELPAWISFCIFSPSITDETTTQAGAARRQVRILELEAGGGGRIILKTCIDAFS